MADADNSVMSSVGGLMRLADPELLMSLGMGLMAGSKYGSNAGEGLLQGLQTYQGMKTSALQRQLMQQQIQTGNIQNQRQQMMLQAAQQALGQGGGQAAQPTGAAPVGPQASAAPFMPGISQMPQGGPSQQAAAPQGLPAGLAAPSMDQIYGSTYPGSADPNYMRAMAMFSQDPAAGLLKVREDQLKSAQQQYAPTIAKLDTLIKSDKPSAYMKADPQLKAAWPQLAQTLGFDPEKDYNDQNVRLALTHARNQLAGSLQEPTVAPVTPEETIPGPMGSIYQRDPVTGKMTQVRSEEPLKDVLVNGQPTAVRASQAEGKQPFNPSIFGAAGMTDQAIQFAADTYRTTGKMPPAFARNPIAQAKVLDRVAADASMQGDTAGSIAARQASLKANGQALDQITKLETATNGYAATLEKNLTNLESAYKKAGNMGSPMLTKAQRFWQQGVTGDPDTASMVTWLNAVQGEYAKLKSGNLGNAPASDAQMRDAKEVINKYMNEGGIAAVSQAMREEAANRKQAIAEQKQSLVGGLSANAPGPNTPTAPKTNAAPAMTNAKGWVLHADKNGNKAYVSPDGKQFEEVP